MQSVYTDLKKNAAGQIVYVPMVDQYGAPLLNYAGLSFQVYTSKDGSAFALVNASTTFLKVSYPPPYGDPGVWALSLAQVDTNFTWAAFFVTPSADDGVHHAQPVMVYARTSLKDFTPVVHTGLLAAVAADLKSVTLASTAHAVNGFYNGMTIQIPQGTNGAGQTAKIVAYNGTTKEAQITAASDAPGLKVVTNVAASVQAISGIATHLLIPGYDPNGDHSLLDALNATVTALQTQDALPTSGSDGVPAAGDSYVITDGN